MVAIVCMIESYSSEARRASSSAHGGPPVQIDHPLPNGRRRPTFPVLDLQILRPSDPEPPGNLGGREAGALSITDQPDTEHRSHVLDPGEGRRLPG